MAGHVFISYGRSDRPHARRIAELLDERGFDVWWDPKIEAGVAYDRVIERALRDAACVVVLWSADAVDSDWVRAEADDGRRRGMLVPVLTEPIEPPLQFRLIETIDLARWAKDDDPAEFERFCAAVTMHVAPADWLSRWRARLVTPGGLRRQSLEPQRDWVSSVRFLGRHRAVTTGGDGVLRSWQLPGGTPDGEVRAHDAGIWSCAAGPGFVATAGADDVVRIWDRDTLAAGPVLAGHDAWVLGCAVSRQGAYLASASRDRSARVWDTASWSERAALSGHRGAVWTCAFTPDNDRLITGADDQTVRVWSVPGGTQLCVMREHRAPVMACAVLPDGETALSAGYDRLVRRWEVRSGRQVATLAGGSGWLLSLALSADGSLAFGGTSNGEVLTWDLASGALIASLELHRGPVMSLDMCPGVGLLSGSADQTAALLSIPPFEERT